MQDENNIIRIKLNAERTSLLDLHNMSRDIMQILVLFSLLENKNDPDLINELKSKKSIFINRNKIKKYVNYNVEKFDFVDIQKGSIIITIKATICMYNIFKVLSEAGPLDEKKLIIVGLKCIYKIADPLAEAQEILDILIDQYDKKIQQFFLNYEIEF